MKKRFGCSGELTGRYGFPIKNQIHIAILSVGIIFKDLL